MRSYHVYTPLIRYHNLPLLAALLEPMGVTWHLIYDAGAEFRHADKPWIKAMRCGDIATGWHPASYKDNWFIEHCDIDDNGRYMHLSDDDWYDADVIRKLDTVEGDVLVMTMHNSAAGGSTLVACPENLCWGRIGGQQIVVRGSVARNHRYGPSYSGDWDFINSVTKQHPPVYVPDAYVHWNKLPR